MTADQREKIQHAIQALIEVESALMNNESGVKKTAHMMEVETKLREARKSLVELNAPEYV
jgi:hypothetical protein